MDKKVVPSEKPLVLTPKPIAGPIDWQTLYERTAAKFPKTLKRLGE